MTLRKRNFQKWLIELGYAAMRKGGTSFSFNATFLYWDFEIREGFDFYDEMSVFCWLTGCCFQMEANGAEKITVVTLPRSLF